MKLARESILLLLEITLPSMGRRRFSAYNDDPFDGWFRSSILRRAKQRLDHMFNHIIGAIETSKHLRLSTRTYFENQKITRDAESKLNNNIPELLEQKEEELKLKNNYYKLRNSETDKIEALFDKLEGLRSMLDSSDSASIIKVEQRIDECLQLWKLHWEKQKVSPPPVLNSYLDREVDLIKERGFAHVKDFNAGDTWHIGPRGGRYRYVNGRKRYDG